MDGEQVGKRIWARLENLVYGEVRGQVEKQIRWQCGINVIVRGMTRLHQTQIPLGNQVAEQAREEHDER